MAELPVECEWGCKRDSQGKKKRWKGGKIHAVVTREGVPIAIKYTSASLHDSLTMIPLVQLAAAGAPHLFDLADAEYDAAPIHTACAELGTIAVIDANPRRSAEARTMSKLEREVHKVRSAAERFFSHLLKSHGGRMVRIRAPAKVALHLLLGAIVVAVEPAYSADGARPEMGKDIGGDGVERPDRPRKLCPQAGQSPAHLKTPR